MGRWGCRTVGLEVVADVVGVAGRMVGRTVGDIVRSPGRIVGGGVGTGTEGWGAGVDGVPVGAELDRERHSKPPNVLLQTSVTRSQSFCPFEHSSASLHPCIALPRNPVLQMQRNVAGKLKHRALTPHGSFRHSFSSSQEEALGLTST